MSESFYAAFMIERSVDVPDQWVAHCLSLDIVTQGNTIGHALQMLQEAICMCVADDKAMGCDSLGARNTAPEADWKRYGWARSGSTPIDADDAATTCALGVLRVTPDSASVTLLRRVLRGEG